MLGRADHTWRSGQRDVCGREERGGGSEGGVDVHFDVGSVDREGDVRVGGGGEGGGGGGGFDDKHLRGGWESGGRGRR